MTVVARTWAAPGLAAVILSVIAVGGVLGYRALHPEKPESLVEIRLARLGQGGSVRLADLHGRPAVVNFFASWCPACVGELPILEKASQDYSGRVSFLGVDERDDAGSGLKLAREARLSYPLASDTADNRLFRLAGAAGMPTTIFVRADGGVHHVYSGALTDEFLRQRIELLLAAATDPYPPSRSAAVSPV
jgi:thiol-disulfide isomerase/thioredoxin